MERKRCLSRRETAFPSRIATRLIEPRAYVMGEGNRLASNGVQVGIRGLDGGRSSGAERISATTPLSRLMKQRDRLLRLRTQAVSTTKPLSRLLKHLLVVHGAFPTGLNYEAAEQAVATAAAIPTWCITSSLNHEAAEQAVATSACFAPSP